MYDYDDLYMENVRNFDELDDTWERRQEAIYELKGEIESGDCMLCGAKNAMKYEGNCFICSECHEGVSEDLYYIWAAGFDIEDDEYS